MSILLYLQNSEVHAYALLRAILYHNLVSHIPISTSGIANMMLPIAAISCLCFLFAIATLPR